MIIDTEKYSGPCTCGKVHSMATRRAVIEAGCMRDFDNLLAQAGLKGRRVALYDTNTYNAKGLTRPHVQQEIVLEASGLRADEQNIQSVTGQLCGETELLIAIGTGTVHDIARQVAHQAGAQLISCPTAASMDGFCSGHSVLCWQGMDILTPGVAPVLVLADLDIISSAPKALTRAGFGEAFSRFTTLADWKTAHYLQGREPCLAIEALLQQAAIAAQGACADWQNKHPGAYAQLMYALVLSGLAMQMGGRDMIFGAAEHHMVSLTHLLPKTYGQSGAMHGEQVGVYTAVISDLYHQVAAIEDITPYVKGYKPPCGEALHRTFGGHAAQNLATHNTPDCLAAVRRDRLCEVWPQIRRTLLEIPSPDALRAMLASIGAKTTMEELGVSSAKLPRMLQLAPCMQNQLTMLRVLRMIKFRYAGQRPASRAPSGKGRCADNDMGMICEGKAVKGTVKAPAAR